MRTSQEALHCFTGHEKVSIHILYTHSDCPSGRTDALQVRRPHRAFRNVIARKPDLRNLSLISSNRSVQVRASSRKVTHIDKSIHGRIVEGILVHERLEDHSGGQMDSISRSQVEADVRPSAGFFRKRVTKGRWRLILEGSCIPWTS